MSGTGGGLTSADNVAYVRGLIEVVHGLGLAAAQKNTVGAAPFDFAVTALRRVRRIHQGVFCGSGRRVRRGDERFEVPDPLCRRDGRHPPVHQHFHGVTRNDGRNAGVLDRLTNAVPDDRSADEGRRPTRRIWRPTRSSATQHSRTPS